MELILTILLKHDKVFRLLLWSLTNTKPRRKTIFITEQQIRIYIYHMQDKHINIYYRAKYTDIIQRSTRLSIKSRSRHLLLSLNRSRSQQPWYFSVSMTLGLDKFSAISFEPNLLQNSVTIIFLTPVIFRFSYKILL